MDLTGKLRQGMRIVGSDDREYGTIERVDSDGVYVGGEKVPHSAFERMDGDRLYVGQAGSRYFADGREAVATTTEGEIRVPVIEERLDVEKRQVDLGEVEVRKTVESEQVNVAVDLMREDVNVRQVDVADRAVAAGDLGDAFKEGTIRVPVRGEEAVVTKEAVVTGEVAIDRERVTEQQTVSDTVRQERVTVDENVETNRGAVRKQARKSGTAEPMTERTVKAEQPVARREGETVTRREGNTGDGESWDELREDVREAGDRTRR